MIRSQNRRIMGQGVIRKRIKRLGDDHFIYEVTI
jgi:hypothetical protein